MIFFFSKKKEEKSSFDIKLSCIERFSPRTLTWFNIIDFNRNTFKTNVHCSMYVYIHISWILKHLHTVKHLSYYMYMNRRTHIHTQSHINIHIQGTALIYTNVHQHKHSPRKRIINVINVEFLIGERPLFRMINACCKWSDL